MPKPEIIRLNSIEGDRCEVLQLELTLTDHAVEVGEVRFRPARILLNGVPEEVVLVILLLVRELLTDDGLHRGLVSLLLEIIDLVYLLLGKTEINP